MRIWFMFLAVSFFASVAMAQPTAGLSIDTVIHEPSADEVGPYIQSIQVQNPNFDPLQPNGEPEFHNVYGNGKGLTHLDDVSSEMYALGGTTTHDLIILTNNTGAQIIIDGASIQIAQIRPATDVDGAPEQASPDPAAAPEIYPFVNGNIDVPDGSSTSVWLVTTKWADMLDTSPRDYIVTFQFDDTNSGNTMIVEADLWVPTVGGNDGSGCTVSPKQELPKGLLLLATGVMAAYVYRRRRLKLGN